jgi:tetratricopeptide (TPR) repeat protein
MLRTSAFGRFVAALVILVVSSVFISAAPASDATAVKRQPASLPAAQAQDPNYWFYKGALCATYGNNKAAVVYFGRAIALDPRHSGAYFSRGVSYGQLGMFSQAFSSIDRAIEIEPQNGLYYYGRARVYLLSGDTERAQADFSKASALGDEDAADYLKKSAR